MARPDGSSGERDGPPSDEGGVAPQLVPLPSPDEGAGEEEPEDGGSLPPVDPRALLIPDNSIWFEQLFKIGGIRIDTRGAARSDRISPNDLLVLLLGAGAVVGLAVISGSSGATWLGLVAVIAWVTWLLIKPQNEGKEGD